LHPPQPKTRLTLNSAQVRSSEAAVELSVGALVLVSVGLTLLEFTLHSSGTSTDGDPGLARLELANDGITLIFVIELTLRYVASPSKRRFFGEYWIDIVAVLPLFRVFRSIRVLRLFRLIRLLRMFGVASRLALHFPDILRRGALEYIFVCGLLGLTVLFGTGAMMVFEGGETVNSEQPFDLQNSFWFSVYSLFAGEPIPGPPQTIGGKIVAVFVMFMGLTIFAMFTGTVSAFMVERLRTESGIVNWDTLENHVIICGWNSKAEIIVAEFHASAAASSRPIAVITQFEGEPPTLPAEIRKTVQFLNDDFTRIAALEQVGVHRAKTCIIMADISGGRSEQDADARTILAALTVEKLNPAVYTCAELMNRSYASHLKMGHVNDFVVSGEFGAYMLAQAAMNRGLMGVFSELLTYQRGNEFYRTSLPAEWFGKSFNELFVQLKQTHNAILVAVHVAAGEMVVNPVNHTFSAGDEIVVIAEHDITL
ncbi:MAG: ion transporter, partial [Planctomycetota bacterium]|nr:ion transporter [Planctomycetota bacterium]